MKGSGFIQNINEIDLDLIEGAAMQKKKKTPVKVDDYWQIIRPQVIFKFLPD